MNRSFPLLAVLMLLVATACTPVPFNRPAAAPTRQLTASDLVAQQWFAQPGIYNIRQSAVFAKNFARIPMDGFLQLDTIRAQARLVGLNEMGIKLFDISVFADGEKVNYVFPELAKYKGFGKAVANSVRSMFLTPLPSAADRLEIAPQRYSLSRRENGNKVTFRFGGSDEKLWEKEVHGPSAHWHASYYEYLNTGRGAFPGGIVLKDKKAGYRLTVWLEEVRKINE